MAHADDPWSEPSTTRISLSPDAAESSPLTRSVAVNLVSPQGVMLAVVVICLLLAGCVWYRYSQQMHWETETPILELRARHALRLGKWEDARADFELARDYAEYLGMSESDPQYRRIAQPLHELEVTGDLAVGSLPPLLQASTRDPVFFAANLAGRSLLLDTVVRKNEAGKVIAELDFPLDDKTIAVDVNELTLWNERVIVGPTRILIGVYVDRLEPTPTGWTLHFQPKRGVFITELAVLNILGLDRDTDLRRTTRQQAALLARTIEVPEGE